MLISLNDLYHENLSALDGDIGQVKDIYFDDQYWTVRFLVMETGSWLSERKVLLSPHAFGSLDRTDKRLQVHLTRQQIQDSPSIDTHKPVSRQYEEEYYRHYGLPFYWEGEGMWGMSPLPIVILPVEPAVPSDEVPGKEADSHLRSALVVNGYGIQANDGSIGHITDFLIDDQSWAIRDLVIKTGGWFTDQEVVIPTSSVERIVYDESLVYVRATRESIKHSPSREGVMAGV